MRMQRVVYCRACRRRQTHRKACPTALWGPLEPLSDDGHDNERDTLPPSSANLRRPHKSQICLDGDHVTQPHFRSHRKQLQAIRWRKYQNERVGRIQRAGRVVRMYQSRHWAMPEARKCKTSYRGRPELVTSMRPAIPSDAPPAEWLRILHDSDYEIFEVA